MYSLQIYTILGYDYSLGKKILFFLNNILLSLNCFNIYQNKWPLTNSSKKNVNICWVVKFDTKIHHNKFKKKTILFLHWISLLRIIIILKLSKIYLIKKLYCIFWNHAYTNKPFKDRRTDLDNKQNQMKLSITANIRRPISFLSC